MKRLILTFVAITITLSVSTAQTNESDSVKTQIANTVEDRDPMSSFILSTIVPIPGAGQLYNHDYKTAMVDAGLFGAGVLLVATSKIKLGNGEPNPQPFIGFALILLSKIHSMIDAPVRSVQINEENASKGQQKNIRE